MRKHRDVEKKGRFMSVNRFQFLVFTIFILILHMWIVNNKKKKVLNRINTTKNFFCRILQLGGATGNYKTVARNIFRSERN